MKFKPLLERWKKETVPARTAKEYAIRLELDSAARLQALAELFPGQPIEAIITDLLQAALEEIGAAMPYAPGPKVISRDDLIRNTLAVARSQDLLDVEKIREAATVEKPTTS